MFLDDHIVEIAMASDPQDPKSQDEALREILVTCLNRVQANLTECNTEENIVPATKQVCNLWDSAARTLRKKGRPFLRESGFKEYLLSKEDLAPALIKHGFK